MNNIKLRYKRGLFWRIINVDYPCRWEELTPKQFIDIVSVISHQEITDADNIFIINTILGLKKCPLFNWPDRISHLNKFLFEIKEPFSKVFITEIHPHGQPFYGPSDAFNNVKIGEFAFADTYFMAYIKTHRVEFMNKVIAALYRPRVLNLDPTSYDYQGDFREPFNENIIDHRASLVDRIPRPVKEAIIFNYRIIRKYIEMQYPYVFPQEKNKDVTVVKIGSSTQAGWDKFLRSLCNGDITQIDKVADQLLHNVMAEANDTIMESNKEA